MKRGLLSIAILLALPTFASAFNCWSVTRNVMPTGQAGTLVPPPSAPTGQYGYKNVGNVTYVTAATGQDCTEAADYVEFTLTPPVDMVPVVRIDGVIQASNATPATGDFPAPTAGQANTYRVNKGTRITHTIQATYAPTATKVAITTVGAAGGYIERSQMITYGTGTDISITPSAGYRIASVKVGDDEESAVELGETALNNVKNSGVYTFSNVTSKKYLTATFAQIPDLQAYIASANATLSIGQLLNLKGTALKNMSTITPTYTWSVAPAGATVVPNASTTDPGDAVFTATAAGTYTVTLTVADAAKNVSDTESRTITVLSVQKSSSNACLTCHTARERESRIADNYKGSVHYTTAEANAPGCSTCHNPTGRLNHPFALSAAAAACATCHPTHTAESVAGNYAALGVNCSGCHDPHSVEIPVTAFNHDEVAPGSCNICHTSTADKFATSLHVTRNGKETFYNHNVGEDDAAPLQRGWGNFVSTPYSELLCAGCHASTDTAWTGPQCTNCHSAAAPATAVAKATCYGCHSRQAFEGSPDGFGLTDVHAALACKACHSTTDMHGDGKAYKSMLDPGAITANCSNCHSATGSEGAILDTIPEHEIHKGNIDCSTCHIQSVVACYNCHFDSEISDHLKFASARFGGQGNKSWRFLVNRVMRDGSTKVFPGSMQSLMADVTAKFDGLNDGKGVTMVAIAPYYSHSVTRTAALRCNDCHGTAKAIALQAGQPVDVVKWLGDEDEVIAFGAPMMAAWQGPQGVIPVPENVGLLKFDFVDVTNSDPTLWNAAAMNLASPRVLFKRGADAIHMPNAYVKPLTADQMQKLAAPQERPAAP